MLNGASALGLIFVCAARFSQAMDERPWLKEWASGLAEDHSEAHSELSSAAAE